MPDGSSSAESGIALAANAEQPREFQVYRERWLVLFICTSLSLTSIMQWVSYSTIEEQADQYFCGPNSDCRAAFLSNQIFQFTAIIFGLPGMYFSSKYGILVSLRVATCLTFAGQLIRMWASYPDIQSFQTRQMLLHAGTTIASLAQVVFMVVPSKIAELWFPENQRSMANVINMNGIQVGIIIGTMLPALIFERGVVVLNPNSYRMFIFNALMALMALTPLLLSFFVRSSTPPTPPSASSTVTAGETLNFFQSLVSCMKRPQFVVQIIVFSSAFASQIALIQGTTVLNWQKYELQGSVVAFGALFSIVACYFAGVFVDKTKMFKELIKVAHVFLLFFSIGLRFYLEVENTSWLNSLIIFAFYGITNALMLVQFPVGIEMGVETAFPVHETISSGILVLFASVPTAFFYFAAVLFDSWMSNVWMMSLYFVLNSSMHWSWWYSDSESGKNWRLSFDLWLFSLVVSTLTAICFMWPRYRRTALEQGDLAILEEVRRMESRNKSGSRTSSAEQDNATTAGTTGTDNAAGNATATGVGSGASTATGNIVAANGAATTTGTETTESANGVVGQQ